MPKIEGVLDGMTYNIKEMMPYFRAIKINENDILIYDEKASENSHLYMIFRTQNYYRNILIIPDEINRIIFPYSENMTIKEYIEYIKGV